MSRLEEWESVVCEPSGYKARLVREVSQMQEAIDFVARSWWRRTVIRWVSGGRVRFEREA
jgi:hypothetical protein